MDNARMSRRTVVWVAASALAIVAVVVAIALAARPTGDATVATSASPTAGDACAGVEAQSIPLDQQVVGPDPRTCFVLEERRQVTVGAAALEPDDAVVLTLVDGSGTQVGSAASEEGWDPEVSLTLEPGTYVIEVTGAAGEAPPFLLYTATFPATSEEPVDTTALPGVDACGDTVPMAADDAPVQIDGDAAEQPVHHACVIVDEAGFVKLGLASPEPSDQDAPDLQLAVYRHGEQPSLVRSADDVIGLDPELSLELEPGTYLLEATAWYDLPTGAFEFYVDDDADLFRRGEVTSMHAEATPQLCEDAPTLSPGEALTVEGEGAYVCLSIPEAQRLTLEAATLTDQDLVLEVMGFDDAGAPYRLAFADEDPYSDVLANFDPLIDQVLPEGTWLVAVTTYFTGTAADYDVALQPTAAQ